MLRVPNQPQLEDQAAATVGGIDDPFGEGEHMATIPRSILNESNYRINQMEYNQYDKSLYLALQNVQGRQSTQQGFKSINTISMWNLDLNLL